MTRVRYRLTAALVAPGCAIAPPGAHAWWNSEFTQRSTVRLLLRAGVDPQRRGSTGQTPLHLAAIAGQVAVLSELLQAGVSIEVLNRSRETALDVAAAAGQQEAMDLLIKAGANLDLAGRRQV